MDVSERSIWILAGEESGDQYGARLAEEIRRQEPDIRLAGMGGHAMAAAEVEILVDSTELGIIGLVEVLRHLPQMRRIFRFLVQKAEEERPAAVVLIDYPGFNLRFAEQMHRRGIKVVYYISPQVWAWKKGRIPKIAAWVDALMCIFPFEPAVYAGTGLRAEFIGHPLLETLAGIRDAVITRSEDTVLLLPGSRRGEIDRLLEPILMSALQIARQRPDLKFVMPLPRQAVADYAEEKMTALALPADMPKIQMEVGTARQWMRRAAAGIAASGTVTIEAGILGLPLIVVYRLNWFSYRLARILVKVPYFAMVNLVAGRGVYAEFLQHEVVPEVLGPALLSILPGGERRADVTRGLEEAVAKLGGQVPASERAAAIVLEIAAG